MVTQRDTSRKYDDAQYYVCLHSARCCHFSCLLCTCQKYTAKGKVRFGVRLKESPVANSCFESVGRETVEAQEGGRGEKETC